MCIRPRCFKICSGPDAEMQKPPKLIKLETHLPLLTLKCQCLKFCKGRRPRAPPEAVGHVRTVAHGRRGCLAHGSPSPLPAWCDPPSGPRPYTHGYRHAQACRHLPLRFVEQSAAERSAARAGCTEGGGSSPSRPCRGGTCAPGPHHQLGRTACAAPGRPWPVAAM